MYLEVIVERLNNAMDAKQHGANRLELVSAISEGGLTPSAGLIESVCERVSIPVQVMLRPHSKSFVYDKSDEVVILRDLERIRKTKAKGVVFGALREDGTIDEALLEKVLKHKGHLHVTFHRAVDEAKDYHQAIETLLKYDIDTLLTSGGEPSAHEGMATLKKIKERLEAKGIELLAGKGLNAETIDDLYHETGIEHVHVGSGVKTNNRIDSEKMALIKAIGNSK